MNTYSAYARIGQNLRSTASSSGTNLGWVSEGAELTVTLVEGENAWVAVTYGTKNGYLAARNVVIPDAGMTCTVTAAETDVRRTPSTNATFLYTVVTGDVLQLLDSTSVADWYRVSTADGIGWAQSADLAITTAPGEEEDDGIVTSTVYAGMVNIAATPLRSSPHLDDTIPLNTQLTLQAITTQDEYYNAGFEDWFMTEHEGVVGYVQAKHIGVTDAGASCTVSAETADVYATPSTDAPILYAVESGDVLQLLDTQYAEGWYRVSTVAGTGWVQASCVTGETDGSDNDSGSGSEGDDGNDGDTGSTAVDFNGMSFSVGDSGDHVYNYVQKPLLDNHYYYGQNPGVFDEDTMWAVKYFQYKNGWEAEYCDGIADQAVLEKLNGQDGTVEAGLNQYVLNRTGVFIPTDLTMDHPLWKNEFFDAAYTDDEEKIGNTANAPAAIAIAFSALTGLAITPPVICREALANNWRDPNGVTGVKSTFWAGIANLHDMTYTALGTSTTNLTNYCANGGIALIRVKDDSEHDYCSDGGATYLVVYKVEGGYIYLQNANDRASSAAMPTSYVSNEKDWILQLYGFKA